MDEKIHRQYEKIGAELDKKSNTARYTVSFTLNMLGIIPFLQNTYIPFRSIISGLDNGMNMIGMRGGLKSNDDTSESRIKENPFLNGIFIMNKVLRAPLYVVGIGQMVYGMYELVNVGVGSGSAPDGLSNSLMYITRGVGMLMLSSSMYLKDKNPKLLEKASVLDTVKAYLANFSHVPQTAEGYSS